MADVRAPHPSSYDPQWYGRIPAVDARDRRYRMAAPATERTFRNWLSPGPVWDQGPTPQCVSYAANRFLTSHRVVNRIPMALDAFYRECQLVDEWEGEGYDGTSVRAAFKVLKRLGLVTSYGWADEVGAVCRQVLEVGPVVMGTDWTEGMDEPDPAGYIWPNLGKVLGGHSWLVVGVNLMRRNPDGSQGAVRMLNSWGADWGQKGRSWITVDEVQRLMTGLEGWPGEACTAVEIKVAA